MEIAIITEFKSLNVPVAISPVSMSLIELVMAIPGIKIIIPAIIIIFTLEPIRVKTSTNADTPDINETAKLLTKSFLKYDIV